jgi:bacterioferritin-associated ferredoxin
MYICVCHAVTDGAIEQAAMEGVRTMKELGFKTGCGTQCGSCLSTARKILEDARTLSAEDDAFPAVISAA